MSREDMNGQEGMEKNKPKSFEEFLSYIDKRKSMPNDVTSERGYPSKAAYLEDFDLIKGSDLDPKDKIVLLDSMSGMMSILGTDAVAEVDEYKEKLRNELRSKGEIVDIVL